MDVTSADLYSFITKAGLATFASNGKPSVKTERKGFTEYNFSEGSLSYLDSYTGNHRSWGVELVRGNDIPIWNCLYGGGMMEGKEDFSKEAFSFLKKALLLKDKSFQSFRGPKEFVEGDWVYSYKQNGGIENFQGEEEIKYKGELIFFHRTLGGMIIN